MNICLSRKDVLCQSKWIVGNNQNASKLRQVFPKLGVEDTITFKTLVSLYLHLHKYQPLVKMKNENV